MIKKSYSKTGKIARVTFKLPGEVKAKRAYLCGDFNAWDQKTHPMKRLKDGSFSLTLSLEPGKQYRYRYWLDNERWENDWEADRYEANTYGSEDSVLVLQAR
jgi:1,4-alpha-glucan branching enzyme